MTMLLAAVAMSLGTQVTTPPVPEAQEIRRTLCADRSLLDAYSANWHAVRREIGHKAQGRNIRRWGLEGARPARCRDVAKSLRTLRGMRFRGAHLLTPSPPQRPPAGIPTLRVRGGVLERIAQCESEGSYSAVNSSNPNRPAGKYQITTSTWH